MRIEFSYGGGTIGVRFETKDLHNAIYDLKGSGSFTIVRTDTGDGTGTSSQVLSQIRKKGGGKPRKARDKDPKTQDEANKRKNKKPAHVLTLEREVLMMFAVVRSFFARQVSAYSTRTPCLHHHLLEDQHFHCPTCGAGAALESVVALVQLYCSSSINFSLLAC